MDQSNQPILHYKVIGEGEPLLLIGGLNVDHTFWLPVAEKLSPYFKLIMPDNRGVGGSLIYEPACTTQIMAEDIIQLLHNLNLNKIHIMGHSLGGCIAQKIAIHYPDKVDKLILCSTQASNSVLKQYQINTMLQMMQSEIPRKLIVQQALANLYSNDFFKDSEKVERAVNFALAKPLEQSRKSYFYQVNALLEHDTSESIKNIEAETLVVGGLEDLSILPSQLEFMAAKIPNSKLNILPNTAHMLPIENAAVLSDLVINFLKSSNNEFNHIAG